MLPDNPAAIWRVLDARSLETLDTIARLRRQTTQDLVLDILLTLAADPDLIINIIDDDKGPTHQQLELFGLVERLH